MEDDSSVGASDSMVGMFAVGMEADVGSAEATVVGEDRFGAQAHRTTVQHKSGGMNRFMR